MIVSLDNIVVESRGITADSRTVESGYAYVAIRGANFNGENFIGDAIVRGAKYIVLQKSASIQELPGAHYCYVDNPRYALSVLSTAFYRPHPETIVAVTGTNGKTSSANFFMQLSYLQRYKSLTIGTLGVQSFNDQQFCDNLQNDLTLTSPDTVTLNKLLQRCAHANFTHISLEASSHGLSQYRLDNINLKAAAFTNLSRDHLDYHGTMSAYFNAKKRLFAELLQENATAVLNADQPQFAELVRLCLSRNIKVISYGKAASDIQILQNDNGTLSFSVFGKVTTIPFHLVGEFYVYNAFCALGLAIGAGLDANATAADLAKLQQISGRLEKVATTAQGGEVYVDYAHTPDALRKVLEDLKKACKQNIILVFGCGGDRDHGKRKIMGMIAEEFANQVVVTDDNPRSEDPAAIRAQVMINMKQPIEIADRYNAIEYAISISQPGDFLLISGKGHEEYQIIGTKKLYFSDRQAVLDILKMRCNL